MSAQFEDPPKTRQQVRERIRQMSDQELLRFGQMCKLMCSSETNFDKTPLESWLWQLRQAREEWRGRHPQLPLSESI